jgi:hypothetical protein
MTAILKPGIKHLTAEEAALNVIAADLCLNLDAKEYISPSCKIESDRIVAKSDISKATLLYKGETFMSFCENPANQTDIWIASVLATALSETELDRLYWYVAALYPPDRYLENNVMIWDALNEQIENGEETVETANECLKSSKIHLLIRLRIEKNCFTADDRKLMFLSASKFNHDCFPNCCWKIEDNILYVYAARKIPKGSELTILYFSCGQACCDNTRIRREFILREAGFWCTCNVCEGNTSKLPRDFLAEMGSFYENRCVNCGAFATKRCKRCQVDRYCSYECQKEHWTTFHKKRCALQVKKK